MSSEPVEQRIPKPPGCPLCHERIYINGKDLNTDRHWPKCPKCGDFIDNYWVFEDGMCWADKLCVPCNIEMEKLPRRERCTSRCCACRQCDAFKKDNTR